MRYRGGFGCRSHSSASNDAIANEKRRNGIDKANTEMVRSSIQPETEKITVESEGFFEKEKTIIHLMDKYADFQTIKHDLYEGSDILDYKIKVTERQLIALGVDIGKIKFDTYEKENQKKVNVVIKRKKLFC